MRNVSVAYSVITLWTSSQGDMEIEKSKGRFNILHCHRPGHPKAASLLLLLSSWRTLFTNVCVSSSQDLNPPCSLSLQAWDLLQVTFTMKPVSKAPSSNIGTQYLGWQTFNMWKLKLTISGSWPWNLPLLTFTYSGPITYHFASLTILQYLRGSTSKAQGNMGFHFSLIHKCVRVSLSLSFTHTAILDSMTLIDKRQNLKVPCKIRHIKL